MGNLPKYLETDEGPGTLAECSHITYRCLSPHQIISIHITYKMKARLTFSHCQRSSIEIDAELDKLKVDMITKHRCGSILIPLSKSFKHTVTAWRLY